MNPNKLAKLKRQRRVAISRLENLKERIRAFSQEQSQLDTERIEVEQEIENLSKEIEEAREKEPLQVTDHAIIRYLERRQGVDIEAIRNTLREAVEPNITALNVDNGTFPLTDKAFAVVEKRRIVTVVVKKDSKK